MSIATKHPFLTFVASGISAFVLIGGAMVTLQAVQQPQSTTSKAYMTTPRYTPMPVPVRGGWNTLPTMTARPTPRVTFSPKPMMTSRPMMKTY